MDDILGRNRRREIIIVRQLYYKLVREKKGFTISKIGELCGRDHSTITNGIKHVNDLLETKDYYAVKMWNKIKGIKG
jgi:chromosomal replication initiation ATPase DnaA